MHKPGGSHVPSASADTVLPPPHGSWNPPFICPPDCLHRRDLRVTETELRGARAQLQEAHSSAPLIASTGATCASLRQSCAEPGRNCRMRLTSFHQHGSSSRTRRRVCRA